MQYTHLGHTGLSVSRKLFGLIVGLLTLLPLTFSATASVASSDQPDAGSRKDVRASIDRGVVFLDTMMDAYQQGTTTRLIQSYSDENGLGSTAFTYDNALTIIAYLEHGKRDDIARARVLGDSMLYAQSHDPNVSDGRLRQAYWVGPFTIQGLTSNPDYFVKTDGHVNLVGFPWYFTGSTTGDMAWAGLSLAQLYSTTHDKRYLTGAVALGNWIYTNANNTTGPGGYTGGIAGDGVTKLTFKSTEHNIDTYAFFTILAKLTEDGTWTTRAANALGLIKAMWNSTNKFFYTGTNPDGVTTNPTPIPEDVQTWSYLALLDKTYAPSIDWAKANLTTTDTSASPNASFPAPFGFTGVTFSDVSLRADPTKQPNPYTPKPDPYAVWFEGSGHIAAALLQRNWSGDREAAVFYLDNIRAAQANLGQNQHVNNKAIPANLGINASSSPLDTGFGFDYFPRLHIGATSWYLMAAQGENPYQLRHNQSKEY